MKQFGIQYEVCTAIGSIVYIAEDGKFAGSIVVADTIKQSSKNAIQKLKSLLVFKIQLCSQEIM